MFDDICTRILSPPKFKYSMYDLGSAITKHGKRTDFIIYNTKQHKMNCSLYQPHVIKHDRLCVVYLHSMNGSRLQGLMYSQMLLQQGISYCTFDFSGCGNSDGQKISFGASEKYDIQIVIKKLKQTFYLNRFILWGRSMGAVAGIKYAELCYQKMKSSTLLSYNKDEVIGMILDSAFKSLSQLLIQIGHTQTQIPRLLIKAGYYLIKSSLQQNGQFNIQQLDLIGDDSINSNSNNKSSNGRQSIYSEHNKKHNIYYPLKKVSVLQLPILFLASRQDKTVPCQHSIDMFNMYECRYKQLRYFKGLHNQSRQSDYIEKVLGFVRKLLLLNKKDDSNNNNNNNNYDLFFSRDVNKTQQSQKNKQQSQSLLLSARNYKTVNNNNNNISININSYKNNNNNNDTIPDPVTLTKQQKKLTLIQLLQQRIFRSTENDGSQTLLQAQTIQSSCVCTMFDSHNGKQQTLRNKYNSIGVKNTITENSYRNNSFNKKNNKMLSQQSKQEINNNDILLKNYNWSKYNSYQKNNNNNSNINYNNMNNFNNLNNLNNLNNMNNLNSNKANFNCDRISLKQQKVNLLNNNNTETKYQQLTPIYTSPKLQNNPLNPQNNKSTFEYHTQKIITTSRSIDNRPLPRMLQSQIINQQQPLKHKLLLSPKSFNHLYKPLRTTSQKDLKGVVGGYNQRFKHSQTKY